RGNAAAADNGRREVTWRTDGNGFNFLQLEPPPPGAANAGRTGGAAGGRGAGGGGGAGGRAGGGAQAPVEQGPPRKDRLFQWLPPFADTDTKLLYEHPTRMTGARFSPDGQIVFF